MRLSLADTHWLMFTPVSNYPITNKRLSFEQAIEPKQSMYSKHYIQ